MIQNLSTTDTSLNHSLFGKYTFLVKDLGQTGEDIKYLTSEQENFSNCDTLETFLIKENLLVKVFDSEGLVLTCLVTRFGSVDDLFNGYVTHSTPLLNEENPNLTDFKYRSESMRYFFSEFNILYGWIPKLPADFITRYGGDKKRNILYCKTLKPISEYIGYNTLLEFRVDAGDIKIKK